jgi:hypothetical protein
LRNHLSALFREDIHEVLMANNRPRGRPISPIQVAIAIAVIIAIWGVVDFSPRRAGTSKLQPVPEGAGE